MSILEYIGSIGGIAGVLAFLIFLAYRQMITLMRDDRRFMEDRLTKVIDEYNLTCRNHQEALLKNTQVLTELITYLKFKNGSK